MRKLSFILMLGLSLIIALSGCKKRKNPTESVVLKQPGYLTFGEKPGWPALDNPPLSNQFSFPNRKIVVTIPGEVPIDSLGHVPLTWKKKYPVLYFLTDFGQDALAFAQTYRVKDIADELTAKGEIQPMIIVIADGNNPMGGDFYLNSIGGNYEKYIAEDVRLQIDTLFFTRIVNDSAHKRGISGVGMGGYGAFRVAMDYPLYYSSVSAISAPLSIDAGPNGDWFNDYLWSTAVQEGLIFSPSPGSNIVPIPWVKTKPATSWLFGMALGFSPHDPSDTDSSSYFKIAGYPIGGPFRGVDLPFDSTGSLRISIWNKWLANDIKTLLAGPPKSGSLTNTKIYFDVGLQDSYMLQIANENFYSFIANQSLTYEPEYHKYTGYGDYPADHFNFAFDRIVTILKFHSKNF
ncbi:MAG TPA: alpha/beta hydrolase-fold protein [candidate division Zixibacteria bacterium]|nr:alpha/beta hydrolase-fold protein [candidate division Zixibacteria bacterium]